MTEKELLLRILSKVEKQAESSAQQKQSGTLRIFSNKDLMDLLGVKDKYMKKLRDNGFIGYSREGDKYWYTQDDVNNFLRRFHYGAFSTNPNLPRMEGGGL